MKKKQIVFNVNTSTNKSFFPTNTAQKAQKCRQSTEQKKYETSYRPATFIPNSLNLNEHVQLEFAGPFPDELNIDAYILVAIDK